VDQTPDSRTITGKTMSEISQKQNKELVKKEDREAKIEEMHKLFTTSTDFSYSNIRKFIDLYDKKKLTTEEEKKREELHLEISMDPQSYPSFFEHRFLHCRNQ